MSLISEIVAEQRRGRQKYGKGPLDYAHDDTHTVEEWVRFIEEHLDKVHFGAPMKARQTLIKIAGLAKSALESIDRKRSKALSRRRRRSRRD